MKLSHFKGLFRTHELQFLSATRVADEYILVTMRAQNPMGWEAGQHGIFTLPGKKIKGRPFRIFSIASAPGEGTILIGSRATANPSQFKGALTSMQLGQTVRLRGPFGHFVVRDSTSPLVLIATGIGITVMRSLLNSMQDETTRPIHLIHSSPAFPLFSDEFKALAQKNKLIKLTFVPNGEELQEALTAVALTYGQSAFYYVSGSPKDVRSTKALLKSLKIGAKRIISDSFFGY